MAWTDSRRLLLLFSGLGSAGLLWLPLLLLLLRSRARHLLNNVYFGTVLQLFKAAVRDHLTWVQACHLGYAIVSDPRRYVVLLRSAVLDHPHESLRAVVLNRRCIDQRHIMQ